MALEVKVPSPGESITQVMLSRWLVQDGNFVEKDAEIAEIDSEKATLSISAEADGVIKILIPEGETIAVGTVICTLEPSETPMAKEEKKEKEPNPDVQKETPQDVEKQENIQLESKDPEVKLSPLARKVLQEKEYSEKELIEKFKRVRLSRKQVNEIENTHLELVTKHDAGSEWNNSRETERKKMTPLRIKLSERLVSVKNETAMLTTFNEVNMSAILNIKKQYNEQYKEKYGVSIGLMSFFTKAVTEALKLYPQVNSMIDGDEFVRYKYADIGIAVSAPKGLIVPVIRNAESLSLAEIELKIKELASKARENRITLDEMSGGTFTITNGGVFGSMLSTPILNPPQSAILGMHNIVERPVAVNGKVEIHPMMYVALSYDHRVIDGRESVGFLVKVKEMLENPLKLMFSGNDPIKELLSL
jgi:2-oxoglutarate dehydrogenase E2 component (dihydrolipoamide succinyltransferase)